MSRVVKGTPVALAGQTMYAEDKGAYTGEVSPAMLLVHAFIRREIARSHGDAVAGAIRILYGGSVKPDNAAALLAQAGVDGALVGGACLEADSFLKIVRAGA